MPRLAFLLVLVFAAAARAQDTVVQLDSGPISGATSGDVRAWKGIPYAAPPTGARRWKPPERPAPWTAVRACLEFGPACPQPYVAVFPVDERKDEDCLYLNVWSPAKASGLPVMVWIHGGSYAFGSGAQAVYDGAALARRGVVVVTINYRLGAFGFFSHPELTRESGRAASGNYGLMDQIAALEWVRRNAAAFGGDPERVTIFGESAGSGSVTALMLSPLARGLFHKAIAQSGVIFARQLRAAAFGTEPAERTGERLAEALGCDGLAALRRRSAQEILDAANPNMDPFAPGMSFGPVVDGWVLPEDPLAMIHAGKLADVPLMIGTTADEGSLFAVASPAGASEEALRDFAAKTLGKEHAAELVEHYLAASKNDARKALSALMGDAFFVAPTRSFARAHAKRSPTFLYQFSRVAPGAKLLGLGAHHAAELRYVFETLDAPGMITFAERDHELARTIAATWVRFAKTGDPNGEGLPAWPAYTSENDAHLELGDALRVGSGLRRQSCDLLEKVWTRLIGSSRKKWH